MEDTSALFAILLLAPLVGFAINGMRFRSHNAVLAGAIGTLAAVVSFACSICLVGRLHVDPKIIELSAHVGGPLDSVGTVFCEWFGVAGLHVNFGFVVDHISAIMILVITGVGTLIHLFSIGYMAHDASPAKYFAYLNLFLFNMLLLVLGDNLLVMFVGWEGVGLCSYLLIGFWFSDRDKAVAGMKAFITNRIGDAGFLLGIFVLFQTFGTVHFGELLGMAHSHAVEIGWKGPITLACLFLFLGATGKSAQIPLYVWLPDAMAGPTPVSALIHAATMVTAGVYMIVRMHPLFLLAPNALHVVAVIGALTALMAATIGITQNDIKKILAYSTVSQLGYMFLACGVGAFSAAMFHLMTHAFFKALMFLGSGSVIHAMHEEQDIRKMGGLRKYLPITHLTFVCGWLAIIGLPPFAGFFSKDEILWQTFHSSLGSPILYWIGLITAVCTAFYMTRLMCLTFWGNSRISKSVHPHESPWTMTLPLIVLAILSVVGGWIGIPEVIGEHMGLGNFLEKWFAGTIELVANPAKPAVSTEIALMGLSVGLIGITVVVAYRVYVMFPETANRWATAFGGFYRLVNDKYRVDELYNGTLINPLLEASRNLWAYVDVNFIDKATYVVGDAVRGLGATAKSFQNGNIQQYALYITMGVAGVIWWLILIHPMR